MRIRALLGDRVNDPLHTNREIIEISQFFIEILGFEVCQLQPVKRGMSGVFSGRLITVNLPDNGC